MIRFLGRISRAGGPDNAVALSTQTSHNLLRARVVLRAVRRRGVVQQAELARALGVSAPTLNETFKVLRKGGILETDGHGRGSKTRLAPTAGYLVGIQASHDETTVAVSDLAYRLRGAPNAFESLTLKPPAKALAQLAEHVADTIGASIGRDEANAKLVGVGLVLPAPILRAKNPSPRKDASEWDRRVQAGQILPGWDRVDVAGTLATYLMAKQITPPRHNHRRFVWMENDASAGALGIYTYERITHHAEAAEDLVYVRVATGIGAGIINKGHLVNGSHGFAGEMHLPVDPSGKLCPGCGARGCLETVASNRAVLEQLTGAPAAPASSSPSRDAASIDARLREALKSSHPGVRRALYDAGWHLGRVLAQICSMLNPSELRLHGIMPRYSLRPGEEPPFHQGVVAAIDREGFEQAIRRPTQQNERAVLPVRGWSKSTSPELHGALALVVDHLGDAYLQPPMEHWLNNGTDDGPIDFRAGGRLPGRDVG